jgi:hypothetical protein
MANALCCFLLNLELLYIILQDCFAKFVVIQIIECMSYNPKFKKSARVHQTIVKRENYTHGKEGKISSIQDGV